MQRLSFSCACHMQNIIVLIFVVNIIDRAPEIDFSELESLFSTAVSSDGNGTDKAGSKRGSSVSKPEIVHLVFL